MFCLPKTALASDFPIPLEKKAQIADRLTVLSVAPLLGEVIRRGHEGRSVGELFDE